MEMVEISPAINYNDSNVNNQLSPQEFQTTLYHWFNQKGIVSNMRSYLRMKMINALKSTSIGETLQANSNTVNLDNQALNVLIADYLFQHGYDYSLSVFSTEVPIKTLVSEFCFFLFNKEKTQYRHKIDEENVVSVIELLGINGNSELTREILKTYKQLERGTLLLCILKVVMNYYKPEKSSEEGNIAEIGKFIKRIMIHFNLPTSVVNHMIENINGIVKNYMKNMVDNISKYHEEEKDLLRREYKNKENEFKQKLIEVDKYLNEENKRIEKEHQKLIYLSKNMVQNERKLAEKCKEMKEKLKKINEFEHKLSKNLKNNIKVSNDETQETEKPCQQVHCSQQCESNLVELERLKTERSEFEKVVANQNHIIANLTTKNGNLYEQVHDSMMKIENLNQQLVKQRRLLSIERRRGEQLSEKTISSSEAMTVGTDGEGDHNIDDAIKESHFMLKQLEKESKEIEQKFQRFRLTFQKEKI